LSVDATLETSPTEGNDDAVSAFTFFIMIIRY